jgi:hypothetical protein
VLGGPARIARLDATPQREDSKAAASVDMTLSGLQNGFRPRTV